MDNINVYYTKLNSNFPKEKFDEYYNELPNILKNKIDRLIGQKPKLHSLIGSKLLSIALNDYNYPKEILSNIKYTQDGKPYIKDTFYFNISHSDNIVICACYKSNIGADIEKIKTRDINKLRTFLNKEEYDKLSTSNEQDRLFAEIWTQKESFSKLISKGMNLSFPEINIINQTISYNNKTWYLYPLNIDDDYSFHICIDDIEQKIYLREIIL